MFVINFLNGNQVFATHIDKPGFCVIKSNSKNEGYVR